MSDLFSSLNDLKAKLNLIEQETLGSMQLEEQEQQRNKQVANLKEKIEQIKSDQSNIIELDVRGEKLQISRFNVQNCIYENILTEKLNEGVVKVFLDFNRRSIREILGIMRFFGPSSAAKKYHIFVRNKDGEEFLVKEILSFFKNPSILSSLEFNY